MRLCVEWRNLPSLSAAVKEAELRGMTNISPSYEPGYPLYGDYEGSLYALRTYSWVRSAEIMEVIRPPKP